MAGSKNSRQRDAILEVLKGTKTHPSADWVYNEVRKIIPNISLGTVYRNLAKLSEENIIIKVGTGLNTEHFDGDTNPHYHVICRECGKIIDIMTEPDESLNKLAAENFDGEIYDHFAIFYGKCAECK